MEGLARCGFNGPDDLRPRRIPSNLQKGKSMTASTALRPLMNPVPEWTASLAPVFFLEASRRSLYRLISVNSSGSPERRSRPWERSCPGRPAVECGRGLEVGNDVCLGTDELVVLGGTPREWPHTGTSARGARTGFLPVAVPASTSVHDRLVTWHVRRLHELHRQQVVFSRSGDIVLEGVLTSRWKLKGGHSIQLPLGGHYWPRIRAMESP